MMNDLSISTSPPSFLATRGCILRSNDMASPPGKVISYCSRFRSTLSLFRLARKLSQNLFLVKIVGNPTVSKT